MKKLVKIFIAMVIMSNLLVGCTSIKFTEANSVKTYEYDEVKDILIRFHVLANSDSDEDQKLKLKVRDAIIEYLTPILKESKSLDESREILNREDKKVKEIANKIIKENGYNYKVESTFDRENFPDKTYGNIMLPQGNYEAYRILIGEAEGQNWWCVMFPPLCFVDVTKGKIAYEKTEKELGDYIEKANEDNNLVYKSKIWEVIKDIFS